MIVQRGVRRSQEERTRSPKDFSTFSSHLKPLAASQQIYSRSHTTTRPLSLPQAARSPSGATATAVSLPICHA
jgi:hypothetical protein